MYQITPGVLRSSVDRYLATFLRHRVLLVLPIVIALMLSTWFALSQPHRYAASTTVWFDTTVPNPSSLDPAPSQGPTPAQQGQAVLEELIGTRQFLVNVGHRGPLAAYLGQHQAHPGGLQRVEARLRSLVGRGSAGARSVDDEIVGSLASSLATAPIGPQILKISMTARDPSVLAGTLAAVIREYQDEVAAERKGRDTTTVAYYQARVTAAQQALDSANAAASAYQQAHASASTLTDPVFAQLVQASFGAQADLATAKNSYVQANLGLQSAAATDLHVIDNVRTPSAPLSTKKKALATTIGGLFGGVTITVLALATLTAGDRTALHPEDIESGLRPLPAAAVSR